MITNTDLIATKNQFKVCLKRDLPNNDTKEFYTIRLLYTLFVGLILKYGSCVWSS